MQDGRSLLMTYWEILLVITILDRSEALLPSPGDSCKKIEESGTTSLKLSGSARRGLLKSN